MKALKNIEIFKSISCGIEKNGIAINIRYYLLKAKFKGARWLDIIIAF